MKKRNIVHSALSLSLTAALCLSMAACGGTQTPADSAAASQPAAPSAAVQPSSAEQASAALPVKALNPKQVEENPYMAKSDANIHHDGYNTDSTDEILPLAIYPEINVSYETTNANASPAIYFDSYGHAVVPLLGGIAIRDLNAEETKTLGYFSPKKHDGGGYVIQSSYTFLDESNRIVCPTSNNHVLMLRATDENGNVLPEFKQKDNKSWNTEEAFIPVLAEMDKQIGRFIKALDELGLSENTIVIFTSDNGPAPSFQSARAAYLRGTKNSLYEGGIRMPFLIKYPKRIKAGQVNNESVLCAVDLYPSLCAIAGIETEKGYQGDGQNYDKVLLGKSKAKRKTDLMWDFGRNQFFKKPGNANDRSPHLAIRSGNWKLLINSDGSDAQLYDIEKDKFEKNDVAQSHPQVVAKLSKKVCKWFEENKDKGKE